jgi:soluble lytic murein transglycosylase-like protein
MNQKVIERVRRWWPQVDKWCQEYGISQALVEGVITQESGGDQWAYRAEPQINDASYGLMQILCGTARQMGFKGKPQELHDPDVNLRFAIKYLKLLQLDFGKLELALAAYNCGPGLVTHILAERKAKTFDEIKEHLPEITQRYVPAVMAAMQEYRKINEREEAKQKDV